MVLPIEKISQSENLDPWVLVKFKHIMVPAVVDSGAMISLINNKMYDTLKSVGLNRKEIFNKREMSWG